MLALASAALASAPSAQAVALKIKVENLAPMAGTLFTPVWVGVHDGSFDLFDAGAPASAALTPKPQNPIHECYEEGQRRI